MTKDQGLRTILYTSFSIICRVTSFFSAWLSIISSKNWRASRHPGGAFSSASHLSAVGRRSAPWTDWPPTRARCPAACSSGRANLLRLGRSNRPLRPGHGRTPRRRQNQQKTAQAHHPVVEIEQRPVHFPGVFERAQDGEQKTEDAFVHLALRRAPASATSARYCAASCTR